MSTSAIPAHIHVPALDFVQAELAVNCFVVSIVLLVVGLRVFARLRGPGLGLDDAFIIFATVCGCRYAQISDRLCAVLYCAVLCCAVLCCAVLCCCCCCC
jgi:hypothetical protein